MKKALRFVALILSVMMLVSAVSFSTVSAATTNFKDVDAKNETLVKAVDLLSYMGITKGVSEDEFGADQAVTREQFAMFMYRLMKGGKDAPSNASNTTKFLDLEDRTYFYAISWANAQGIVNGTSDTTFHPKNGITLQDAYTMVVRALDYEEDEDLIYPHGYIDIAEREGVELDNGLPSDIGYEDALSRGDMAIILYNAFFAETAIPTVETKVVGEEGEWYLKEVTTYDRLCEKHFDVKEVKYQAVGTPHYALGNDNEATYELGYDALFLRLVEDEETETDDVPEYYYFKPEEIGLDAKELDNYFLGEFTMFVTTNKNGDEIERVLFSDCNMVKETVSDLKFTTIASNKADSYYADSDGKVKLLSGRVDAGNKAFYVFNAPYTYTKPNYATNATSAYKYEQRNEKNILEIDFELFNDNDVDYYRASEAAIVTAPETEETDNDVVIVDEYFTLQAEELVEYFEQAYYGGLYEADLYDVNGDGIYDYIDYKPYWFFQVDSDKEYDFTDSEFDEEIPYIYTNEATVLGAKFEDEDYVIGYFDEATNTVKVADVVKPTLSSIEKVKTASGSVVLADGSTVNAGSAWKLVANYKPEEVVFDTKEAIRDFADASGLMSANVLDDEERELYIYNGVVLKFDGVENDLKFTENLIIPFDVDGNVPEKEFNKETGDRVWYVYAWINGECKYVPVETEDVYPAIIDGGNLTAEYDMQLCTYTIDAHGIYTIKSLGFAEDEDGNYKGVTKDPEYLEEHEGKNGKILDGVLDTDDEDAQFIVVDEENVTMKKVASSRFDIDFDRTVILKPYTKILVLVEDEDGDYEMVEYDATNFKSSVETAFDTVTYLVSNNPDSKTRENLVLLFATMSEDLEFEAKKDKDGQRIVSLSTPGLDEDGYYRNYYELFNPLTGAKETDVAGNSTSKTATGLVDAIETGCIVELKGGLVDEKGYEDEDSDDYLGRLDTADEESGLVWITEYDEDDDYIAVVPVSATVDACCKETFSDAIEGYVFDGSDCNFDGKPFVTAGDETDVHLFYEVNKKTAVTVLKYTEAGLGATKWGTMTLGDISILANAKKDYKCYNSKVEDSKGNYNTEYAQYLKAYVSASYGDNKEKDTPVADYIIIVVNGDENLAQFVSEKDCETCGE